MDDVDEHLRRIYARQEAAIGDQQGEEAFEAALRASLEYMVENLDPGFAQLEAAFGQSLDPGSFLMGSLATVMFTRGTDFVEAVVKRPVGKRLLTECVDRARRREGLRGGE